MCFFEYTVQTCQGITMNTEGASATKSHGTVGRGGMHFHCQ